MGPIALRNGLTKTAHIYKGGPGHHIPTMMGNLVRRPLLILGCTVDPTESSVVVWVETLCFSHLVVLKHPQILSIHACHASFHHPCRLRRVPRLHRVLHFIHMFRRLLGRAAKSKLWPIRRHWRGEARSNPSHQVSTYLLDSDKPTQQAKRRSSVENTGPQPSSPRTLLVEWVFDAHHNNNKIIYGYHVPGPTRLEKMSKPLLFSRLSFWRPGSGNSGDCHV